MMRFSARRIFVLAVAVLLGGARMGLALEAGEAYFFPYFVGNGDPNHGDGGLFLSTSADGVHFRALNGGKPIVKPNEAPTLMPVGQQLIRDASIIYHEGVFDLVWTTNWKGNVFGFAQSTDLVHWTGARTVQPFADAVTVQNVWAPEIHWNPVNKNYVIIFSASFTPADYSGDNMRIYSVTSGDLKTFSTASTVPFFESGASEIDGQMVYDAGNDRWVLVYKNEAKGQKNLNLAFIGGNLEGKWTAYAHNPIVGPKSGVAGFLSQPVEAPTLVKTERGWNLYFDHFSNHNFAEASTTDAITPEGKIVWKPEGMTNPVGDPRHGTIFVAPVSAVGFMKEGK
jgi:Glycosyl hydrolases family 43